MRQHHPPGEQGHTAQLAPLEGRQAGNSKSQCQNQAKKRQDMDPANQHDRNYAHRQRSENRQELALDPRSRILPPTQQRPDHHHQQHRDDEDRRHRIEIGWSDRDAHAKCFGHQRIKCPQQDDRENCAQHDVVEHQRTFTTGHGKAFALDDRACAQREEQQRPADIQRQQYKDESAALGIDRKGMDAGQNTRSNEERPQHTHRKGNHAKHDRPGAQGIAGSQNRYRMQKGSCREPRHQRGVFDRIPEPPAAPAQFVIGPV